jgi:hypothetical protein
MGQVMIPPPLSHPCALCGVVMPAETATVTMAPHDESGKPANAEAEAFVKAWGPKRYTCLPCGRAELLARWPEEIDFFDRMNGVNP